MYENNLQYHSIENFKKNRGEKRRKKQPLKIPKPISIKKTIINPVSSGTVDLGNTVGSEPVFAEDDYNEIDDDELLLDNDDELLLDNDDEGISKTLIIIIGVFILLLLTGLYLLI